MQAKIRKFGGYLSGMVMPIIAAFIAWGLITALFIPTGWVPNEALETLVGPMITYLLPILIGYNGGKLVYGDRGAVVGATATMGAIVASSVPMFLGGMIVGPLGGFAIKQIDKILIPRTKTGFEMLVNNFSAGIVGLIVTIVAFWIIGPLINVSIDYVSQGVAVLVDNDMLFLTAIIVEPAKILFLNNALNHGIFSPLGAAEALETGKSILFMIETNPGPGLGVLLAYMFFGKGTAKSTSPGAAIIHFFGGIHEIYFPYVLMNPIIILAPICGGMAGILTASILDVGLVATPSPGSIFALMAMAPQGSTLGVIISVVVSTAVSLLVAMPIVKMSSNDDLEESIDKVSENKGSESRANILKSDVKVSHVYFCCDAGMGSSAMGSSVFKKLLADAEVTDVTVSNCAIKNIPADAKYVITQKSFDGVIQNYVDASCEIRYVNNFLDKKVYNEYVEELK